VEYETFTPDENIGSISFANRAKKKSKELASQGKIPHNIDL
jgi:hypothetical protein